VVKALQFLRFVLATAFACVGLLCLAWGGYVAQMVFQSHPDNSRAAYLLYGGLLATLGLCLSGLAAIVWLAGRK
jgi:hypothetical protein